MESFKKIFNEKLLNSKVKNGFEKGCVNFWRDETMLLVGKVLPLGCLYPSLTPIKRVIEPIKRAYKQITRKHCCFQPMVLCTLYITESADCCCHLHLDSEI